MKKEYRKPMIEEEVIEVEDICITSGSATTLDANEHNWGSYFLGENK